MKVYLELGKRYDINGDNFKVPLLLSFVQKQLFLVPNDESIPYSNGYNLLDHV